MNELVSIVIPVYNAEKYICNTIDSVLNQTYENWEMLLVDDCSQDNSAKLISRYSDQRIKYFKLEENSGAAVARNKALENAKGRYIAFLDADDMWKSQKLEKQLNFMQSKNIGFSFTSYEIMNDTGNKIIKVPNQINYNQFMKNTIIGNLTVMIDKNIIGDFRIVNIRKAQDSMTWAKLLRSGHIAYGLNESLAYYRKVEGSLSNDKFKAAKRHWDNYRNVEKLSFLKCSYYFAFYAFNAVKKHYL